MLVADELLRRSYRELRALRARVEGHPVNGVADLAITDEIRAYLAKFDVPLEPEVFVQPQEPRRQQLHINHGNVAYKVYDWLVWTWQNVDDIQRCKYNMNKLEAIHLSASENLAICQHITMLLANHADDPQANINALLASVLLEQAVREHLVKRRSWLDRLLGIGKWEPNEFEDRLTRYW